MTHPFRREKLAVASSGAADVDEDAVGAVLHLALPIARGEGHDVGGEGRWIPGMGDAWLQ